MDIVVVNLAGASNWLRIQVTSGQMWSLMRAFVSGHSNLLLIWMSLPTDLEAFSRHWAILAKRRFASGSSSCRWNAIWIDLVCPLGLSAPTLQFADTIGSVLKASTPYIRVPLPVPLYASMKNSSQASAAFSLTSSAQIEHMKSKNSQVNCSTTPIGCPKTLAELIRRGTYNPLDLQSLSVHNLQEVCSLVGIPYKQTTTKVSHTKLSCIPGNDYDNNWYYYCPT